MKLTRKALVLIAALISAPLDASTPEISGSIIKGLRILDVDSKRETLEYTVYRGDYIKFRYGNELGSQEFQVPTLDYKGVVDGNIDNGKYYKMKETGTHAFTLGKKQGKLTIIEYERPNYKAVSAAEGQELIKNIQPLILDVRTPGEFKEARIEGARLIPISNLQEAYKEIEEYKNQDILIYCATGNRSTVAAKILADQGFKRIYNLRYGIGDWYKQGYPVGR